MASPFDTDLSVQANDTVLERLLTAAGPRLALPSPSAALARDILAGIAAAPEPWDGERVWMKLLVENPDSELADALRGLKAKNAAAIPPIAPATKDVAAARLAALRAEMAAQGLSGFVVPLSDPHQLENPPACAQRLRWLTGFTGSAGIAVVLAHEAALFVDGRYTLQAQKEVDSALYRLHHISERPPAEWAAANLGTSARLGFDPWTMTEDDVKRFSAALTVSGALFVPVEPSPVDAIWHDRPPAPLSAVMSHDQAFAGVSSAEKRRGIGAELAAHGVEAAILTLPDSIAWLLNVRGGDVAYSPLMLAFAILHANGSVDLFVDPRKLGRDVRARMDPDVAIERIESFAPALDRLAARGAHVQADPASAPAAVFAHLSGAHVVQAADPCQLPKACKNVTELSGMRAAHERDGVALVRFFAWLETAVAAGIDEFAVAERLLGFRAQGKNFRGLSFATIAGDGPNGAIVHYHSTPATNRTLAPGDVFLLDSGAQYWDGTTDVTRTLAVPGAAPSRDAQEAFTRVLKGHIALACARFPDGTSGSQLDALARMPLWEVGLDYDHGTGHGVGFHLGVHEGPQRISKIPNRVALKPGMVVSIEPGYYRTGAFGIRIENLAAVTDAVGGRDGEGRRMLAFETLTMAPIDRALIRPDLLTVWEKAWLDAYHARVRDRLTPQLDPASTAWLARATQPIAA